MMTGAAWQSWAKLRAEERPVGGVVVLDQQARDQISPGTPGGEGFPRGDLVAPVQCDQAIELLVERGAVGQEMPVLVQQQVQARRHVGLRTTHGEARMRS